MFVKLNNAIRTCNSFFSQEYSKIAGNFKIKQNKKQKLN